MRHYFLLFLLVMGLGCGVFLAQRSLIVKSFASSSVDDTINKKEGIVVYSDLEEKTDWTLTCKTFTDGYPSITCPGGTSSQDTIDKKSGAFARVLNGTRKNQEVYSKTVLLNPNKTYKITVALKIKNRVVYNYLDIQNPPYPVVYTNAMAPSTKGIWGGTYTFTLNNGTTSPGANLLSNQFIDGTSRASSDIDWFVESSYFTTTTTPSDSAQQSRKLELTLNGFEGKFYIDHLTIEEVPSAISDDYFYSQKYLSNLVNGQSYPVQNYQGMSITRVTSNPMLVQTNAARFTITSNSIVQEKYLLETDSRGTHGVTRGVSTIKFPDGFLNGLTQTADKVLVRMQNNNILISVNSDSTVIAKLKKPAVISVEGNTTSLNPTYSAFQAGVIFVADDTKGVLFSPLRTSLDLMNLPHTVDKRSNKYLFDDALITTKNWTVLSPFNSSKWKVQYNFKSGEGFLTEVFPPKDENSLKKYQERAALIQVTTTNPNINQGVDYSYAFQKFKEHYNVGIIWSNEAIQNENNQNPPDTYCIHDGKPIGCAIARPLHSASPSTYNLTESPVNRSNVTGGPYTIQEQEALRNLVTQAHQHGVKLLLYLVPGNYYTANVDLFLANVSKLLDDYKLDGVYYDGQYREDALKNYELVIKTRRMLGNRFYLQHRSTTDSLITGSSDFSTPFETSWADLAWTGEGIKDVADNLWRINYCSKNVSNTPTQLFSEYRPVDWANMSDPKNYLTFTKSPFEQTDKQLNCGGSFRVNPYTELAGIGDKRRTEGSIYANANYFYNKWDTAGIPVTCGNGVKDPNESILNCSKDWAPPLSTRTPQHSVAQVITDGKPLYKLHFTFNGSLVTDDSGNKQNPSEMLGYGLNFRGLPSLQTSDTEKSYKFPGTVRGFIDGERGKILDMTNKSFSLFTRIKRNDSSTGSQVIFTLDTTKKISIGLKDNHLKVTYANDQSAAGTKTILDTNWHTLGFTYNYPDKKLTLYVDGQQDTVVTNIVMSPALTSPVTGTDYEKILSLNSSKQDEISDYVIGSLAPFDKDNQYNGFIDDLIVTDTILSAAQIQDYHATVGKSYTPSSTTQVIVTDGSQVDGLKLPTDATFVNNHTTQYFTLQK